MEYAEDFDDRWASLEQRLTERFGKQPDLNAILFLIGIQELGMGISAFTKEQKQDLMHIATCKLFSLSGYYQFAGTDADGWPHYTLLRAIPMANLKEQEKMLKWHVLEYFDQEE
ncbi:hypothetical protein BH24BAC1_BH24BAC1_07030 [soil metagenome]|jgi:hypothetical protein